jgi:hypothetical protein
MKKVIEYNFSINYNFDNSKLNNSPELINSMQNQQPNTHNTL